MLTIIYKFTARIREQELEPPSDTVAMPADDDDDPSTGGYYFQMTTT